MWGGGDMWGGYPGGKGMGGMDMWGGGGKGSDMDMWGASGADYGWGPWASARGKGGGAPYGKGGGGGGGGAGGAWGAPKKAPSGGGGGGGGGSASTNTGPMPEIVWLALDPSCSVVAQGFPTDVPAIEFDKSKTIFSEAHHILQDFFDGDITEAVEFTHDPECDVFPEVYEAWKTAGQEDNCPTVATCPGLAKWGVGFGGKANALRAAKLALALSIATDPAMAEKAAQVVGYYPAFGKLITAAGGEGAAA